MRTIVFSVVLALFTAAYASSRITSSVLRLATALREYRHLRGSLVLHRDDGAPLTEGLARGSSSGGAAGRFTKERAAHLHHTFCSHLAMRGAPPRRFKNSPGIRTR
jgi:hypothetical protein